MLPIYTSDNVSFSYRKYVYFMYVEERKFHSASIVSTKRIVLIVPNVSIVTVVPNVSIVIIVAIVSIEPIYTTINPSIH